jgi:hypothetical protein
MLIGMGAISSSPAADTIAQTIQKVEGYYPGTLAYTNNNPGNLIYVGQTGATPGAGGFASFPSYDAGYQALLNQIQNYANRGLTIQQMMNLYAPAGQGTNNPTAYANTIASSLGVSVDTPLSDALAGSPGATPIPTSTTGSDSMTVPSFDIPTALSDFGTAFSSGTLDAVTSSDWLVVGGGLALLMLGVYLMRR